LLLPFALSQGAVAQSFSYVYIQGDKQLPFYVKLEDQMQPRYGKNYCIISQLAPGPINIEVLFQQNMYPPQKFTIKVPDNSYREFLLTRKGDAFSLYDIRQQFYLPAGNSAEDDHMPLIDSAITTHATSTPRGTEEIQQPIVPIKKSKNKKQQVDNTPQFMNDIELNSDKSFQKDKPIAGDSDVVINTKIPNSDCPKPIGNSAFEDIFNRMQDHDSKSRLKFLLGKLDKCFTTNQVRILTKGLNDDPERFEFLKQAYSRVTDQSSYTTLESLLSTQEWKDQFHQIIK